MMIFDPYGQYSRKNLTQHYLQYLVKAEKKDIKQSRHGMKRSNIDSSVYPVFLTMV
jgi:hypothetical protein